MLQFLRSTAGSWVVKILFVILIASFAVWGIGDIFRGQGPDTTVAEVGPFTISAQEVDREFRTQLNQLRPVLGDDVSIEQARALGLVDRSLQGLIERALFQLAARDLDLAVGPDLVRRRLQASPNFRNDLGRFDPELFRRFLAGNGMTEAGYIALLQEEIARELLLGAVVSGVVPPQPLVEALYRHRQEQRVAETLFVPDTAMGDPGQPTEDQLKAYYEDNAVAYTAPEYRRLTIATLSAEVFADRIELTDEAVRAEFEQRPGDFIEPERRTVTQVVLPTEAAAQQVLAQVRAGTSLAEAAAAAGTEAPITFEAVAQDELPDLGPAAFALAAGETGGPVQTAFGWHVLAVGTVTPGGDPAFETVRDRVAAELRRDRAIDRLYEASNQLDDLLGGGATLDTAAAELGVPLRTVEGVDAEGKTAAGTPPAETIPHLGQILSVAFGLREGGQSLVTETDDGSFFIVRVDGVTPAQQRPLDVVRAAAVAGWQAAERATRAESKARALAEAARTGSPMAELAAANPGLEMATTEPMTRVGPATGRLTQGLQQRLFTLAPGDVIEGTVPEGRLVVKLASVAAADPAAAGEALEGIEGRLGQEMAEDLLTQYLAALRQTHDVTINHQALDAAF